MANKGTQERQCQTGTADLAEAVLDCLSTGMKITEGFVFVVVSFSAISAMAAVSAIPAGSVFSAASAAPNGSGSLEVPEHSGPPGTSSPPQGTEVVLAVSSGHSGEVLTGVGGVSIALNSIPGLQVTLVRSQLVVLQLQLQLVQSLVLQVQLVKYQLVASQFQSY